MDEAPETWISGAGEEFSIRSATGSDIDSVAQLESQIYSTPWSAKSFAFELQQPRSVFWVLAGAETLAGYQVGWQVLDSYHLHNIAVHPAYRGQGAAAFMLKHLLAMCRDKAMSSVELEVRVSNKAAQGLYEGFGFFQDGLRKNYYQKPTEDAVLMRYLV